MLVVHKRGLVPEAPQYNASLVARSDETESLGYPKVTFDGEATPFGPGQYTTIGVLVEGDPGVPARIVQRPARSR